MIVVATYNNVEILKRLLESLGTTKNLDEEVLVIGTDTSQKAIREFLKQIARNNPYDFLINTDFTPYKGYDSGAYIYAYKNHPADYYIFLQDSLSIKNPKWLKIFKSNRDENLNAWVTFRMHFDSDKQRKWVSDKFKNPIRPQLGVFGPVFQISKNSLDEIDKRHDLSRFIPESKWMQQGMERGWGYLARNSDMTVTNIDGASRLARRKYIKSRECFHKYFYVRQ